MARWHRLLGIALALTVTEMGKAQEVEAVDGWTRVQVRVYDYVGVAPDGLRKAQRAASEIFWNANVEVDWVECGISEDQSRKDPRCEPDPTPLDLHLRIVGRKMAEPAGTHRDAFGYAWIVKGYGIVAAAYYHRAVEIEMRDRVSRWAVLGGIIAHEVGHLLLGNGSHAASGIMLAGGWGRRELQQIAQGRLRFSDEPIRQMGQAVVARGEF